MRFVSRARALAAGLSLAALLGAAAGDAGDARDEAVLDSVVRDLGISLSSRPESNVLRLPLATDGWSLFGHLQPYASVGPRAYTLTGEPSGLAAPPRDTDDFARGVGVGAGLNWRLTDRLQLFGEYQFLNMGGHSVPDGTLGRRDIDNPGLRGGFSIRF